MTNGRNLEHSVERHEEAVNQGATDIRKIKEQIGLIAEALGKIEMSRIGRDIRRTRTL